MLVAAVPVPDNMESSLTGSVMTVLLVIGNSCVICIVIGKSNNTYLILFHVIKVIRSTFIITCIDNANQVKLSITRHQLSLMQVK